MDDEELIALIRTAPERGLAEAIRLHGGAAKAVAIRMLGRDRPQDVEEALSDAFVRLWRNADSYRPQFGSFRGFLCAIARNCAIDLLRKKRPDQMEEGEEESLPFEPDFVDDIAAEHNRRVVRETVDALDEPDRAIFTRRYFLCESVDAIARGLGLDYKAVENRLYRGRRRMRDALLERGIIL